MLYYQKLYINHNTLGYVTLIPEIQKTFSVLRCFQSIEDAKIVNADAIST